MAIESLQLTNFRVHNDLSLKFAKGITAITGQNGSGKTSILEAVCISAYSRSFRSSSNNDFITKKKNNASIRLEVEINNLFHTIDVDIQETKKNTLLNKKKIQQRRKIIEILPTVIFSPSDHKIIDSDSSERRHFFNQAISNANFFYADLLKDFQKVLFQRNQILKNFSRGYQNNVDKLCTEIDVWNEQLIFLGSKVIRERMAYVKEFLPLFNSRYQSLSKKEETVGIEYIFQSDYGIPNSCLTIENYLKKALRESLKKDILLGTTGVGPHRDDFLFTLSGAKFRTYGSQGEKRTAVLALKLAEVDLFQYKHKISPILLLDDISSELDMNRRKALVEILYNGKSQVLITSTELPTDILNELSSPYEHIDLQLL